MAQILGIALWALIPGFVAKTKGRNFWGWYFLSFLISPLITMIITFCLSNIAENKETETTSSGTKKISFCRKCGEPLMDSSKFCRKCGTEVIELKLTNIPDTQEFKVIIFDTGAGKMRTEMRKVDVKKFPPEKFSDNNTYYAVETMKEGKKVRIYCTKNNWEKQIENNKATEV